MADASNPNHPLLLIVIDGWGLAPPSPSNAIQLSRPKVLARFEQEYPYTTLHASGEAVGLPPGQMGNSEVGHLNIGAGRVVDQDFVRITKTIREGKLGAVPALRDLSEGCRTQGRPLHVIGLLGPGGVHSHEEHLFGLLEAAQRAKVPQVWVHHVLDGRDTPPKSAREFVDRAQQQIDRHANARVATVSGRYWTMDRDKRWERTERAFRMLTERNFSTPNPWNLRMAATAREAVEAAYGRGETDEFVEPTILPNAPPIRDGDAVLIYNFRPDRVRQLVRALKDPDLTSIRRTPLQVELVSMTLYDKTFDQFGVRIAFQPTHPVMTIGEYYAQLGLRQLRIAETEKYAHVTYFFSGGREDPFPNEDRVLVPSPKVATYDLQPRMSAREVTVELLKRLETDRYDLIVLNFANPDMVGHTGKIEPTVAACQVVDECIGRLAEAALAHDYVVAVTADHGNAEQMHGPDGGPQTAHTTNPVPFHLIHPQLKGLALASGGGLASVAPTLLALLGLPIPPEMTSPALVPLKKAAK